MAILKKSTAWNRAFLMVQSSDHITPLTGATVTVVLSKNAGTFAAAGGAVTEIANGWYYVALNTTDTGTAGDLAFHCTATSGDPTDFVDQVWDPTIAEIGVNVVNIAGQAAVLDANNFLKVDVEAINAFTLAAQALAQSTQSIPWGTCGSGSTTSIVNASSINNPASLTDGSQLQGRIIIFLGPTTTAGLQAQAALITSVTSGATPAITLNAPLTRAPVSGDKFVII